MAGTRPAHIAFVNLPMQGHLNPTLGVVAELVRRGHRVTYGITEDFVHAVKAAGGDPVLYPIDAGDGGEPPERLAEGFALAIHASLGSLPALTRYWANDRPDLIVYDVYGFAGLVLAEQWRVPTVLFSPTHMFYDGIVPELFDGACGLSSLPGYADLAAAFEDRGLDSARIHEIEAPDHAVAALPYTFQRNAETVAARRIAYVGPALDDRTYQGTWQPTTEDPVLLISLGSQFNCRPEFYRACLEAFAEDEHHVVMSVGPQVPLDRLGPIPSNFEVHAHVPQLSVLHHTDVFISHAGMGGTMEALHHGVPIVAVPQMSEQRVNASQIEALDLGAYLPRDRATPEALRDAVEHVTSSLQIRAGISALRSELAHAGGTKTAADLIEEALGGNR